MNPYYSHPDPSLKNYWTPSEFGMKYENITVLSPESKEPGSKMLHLHGWFIYHEEISKKIPTIVYFHENDYFPPARIYMIEKLHNSDRKHNVVMVDYRGYGLSEGYPTDKGIDIDAVSIVQHVLNMEQVDPEKIIIFGAAFGGFFATEAALHFQNEIKGLILQNASPSFLIDIKKIVWFLKPILPYILYLELNVIDKIPKIAMPIMFIKGMKDDILPFEGMYEIERNAKNSIFTMFYEVHKADHYSTWYHGGKQFDKKLTNFIES
jgi:abhydrolase domain-containing protein 13